MNKKNFSRYNDGVISIYREKENKSNFGAKENVSVLDDMNFIAKLDFEECSKREQDLEYAEQMGFSLTLKVKTRLLKAINNECKAVIDGYLYDIFDVDKTRTEMFIYMQGVKQIVS